MHEDLIDRIYEAAFVPDQWPRVLDSLAERTGSAAGQIMIFNDIMPVQYQATELTKPVLDEFQRNAWQQSGARITHFLNQPCYGFVLADQYFPSDIRDDESRRLMIEHGFDSQLGTIIPMPSGELAVIAVERWARLGPHEDSAVDSLNALHPHIARAALMASRLGIEKAQNAVSTLEALGVPAASMTRTGKVMAVNGLFQQSITNALTHADNTVRSIPVPARDEHPPCVVHIVPLFRDARDTLFGAEILVAVTTLTPGNLVPSAPVLMGLFDLTPSEARLATELASGRSLKEAAANMGLGLASARKYLERVFLKTGTHRQGELVSLLKGALPIAPE